MAGVVPPLGRFVHVSGIDLVRGDDGTWRVLEDNLRCPSGLSYVIQNRAFMRRAFPEAFGDHHVEPVGHAPFLLLSALMAAAPEGRESPRVVVLTPGPANAAYYEHAFLAQQMGVALVEGRDLTVRDRRVYLRTTAGRERVDVIYRRIDDGFLDPAGLRSDSLLGVAGLMQVVREGRVAVCNAIGHGRCRRQGDLRLRARHHPVLPRRGAAAGAGAHLSARAAGGPRARARQPRHAWW